MAVEDYESGAHWGEGGNGHRMPDGRTAMVLMHWTPRMVGPDENENIRRKPGPYRTGRHYRYILHCPSLQATVLTILRVEIAEISLCSAL